MTKAIEMAKEFKRYMELENETGRKGDIESAEFYMAKKWETSKAAEVNGMYPEFEAALKEMGVY